MKILHTSDWHIGRSLGGRSLIEDQAYTLEAFVDLARREAPDVILIAGDLYDRTVPAKDALTLADSVLSALILDLGIPIIIIGGNHDGGERLAFTSGILEKRGLYIRGCYDGPPQPIRLNDAWGPVDFWPLPFVKPVEYRDVSGDTGVRDFDALYDALITELEGRLDPAARNVLIAHGLVSAGPGDEVELDDSVRPLEIGGVSCVDAGRFSAFDYVALGHLHRPQRAGSEAIRYAGSLLKYSFSETLQKKSVTLLDMDGSGALDLRQERLPVLRDMRIVEGQLEDLTDPAMLDDPAREDFIKVVLTDTSRRLGPMDRLRQIYPNVLEMTYKDLLSDTGSAGAGLIKERLTDPLALIGTFFESIHGRPMSDEQRSLAAAILEETHAAS